MKRSGRSSLEVSRLRSLERRAVERERERGRAGGASWQGERGCRSKCRIAISYPSVRSIMYKYNSEIEIETRRAIASGLASVLRPASEFSACTDRGYRYDSRDLASISSWISPRRIWIEVIGIVT
jgi:hypothetical protein